MTVANSNELISRAQSGDEAGICRADAGALCLRLWGCHQNREQPARC